MGPAGRDTATRVSAGRWDRRVGATTRWRGEVFAGPGERVRAAGASWAAGTCWAERDEGRAGRIAGQAGMGSGPQGERERRKRAGLPEWISGRVWLASWVWIFYFSSLF